MLSETEAVQVIGGTAYDVDGEKIGKIGQVFLDDETGRPEFVTVNTGFFGTSESFVPVEDATVDNGDLRVSYSKEKVKDAPHIDLEDGHMDREQERKLFDYYGGADAPAVQETDAPATQETDAAPVGRDVSGPETDEAMTRSEEHLKVGTTTEEASRVRLRKYVTTETETRTVPVRKEHAVLVTEPITEGNAGDALEGPAISEEEHEVVLHEERPVVETVVEPVERVRLGTETSVEEVTVDGEVRKEHIETEGDVEGR